MVPQEDESWLINGSMQLQEMLERFGIENGGYDADTVGGWIGEMIRRVPENGDIFETGGYRFEVTEMDGFRVTKIRAEKVPEEKKDSAEEPVEAPEGEE
jgi:CBS domain containing-hemolysin-like protein